MKEFKQKFWSPEESKNEEIQISERYEEETIENIENDAEVKTPGLVIEKKRTNSFVESSFNEFQENVHNS